MFVASVQIVVFPVDPDCVLVEEYIVRNKVFVGVLYYFEIDIRK